MCLNIGFIYFLWLHYYVYFRIYIFLGYIFSCKNDYLVNYSFIIQKSILYSALVWLKREASLRLKKEISH